MLLCSDRIFVAPSGVQKERIQPSDLFIVDNHGEVTHGKDVQIHVLMPML